MEWIIGIIAVLFVLVTVFGRLNERPKTPPSTKLKPQPSKTTPKVSSVRAYHDYATIFENHEHRPLTLDQVAEMFGGIRERLKEHRKAAKAMQKLADKFLETGKLDDVAYAALTDAESDARRTIDAAEALNDKLYFNNSSASSRYYKFVDDLWEAESDIEFARRDIQDTRQAIEDGEFIPQKRVKSKAVKKPPKGSKPNVRMRYRSMSENEAEWEILIVGRNGKSFVGWSFECVQEFNFNVAGIVWAEDMATHQRIANFETYLDDLFRSV